MSAYKVAPFFLEFNMNNDDTLLQLYNQSANHVIKLYIISDYFSLTIKSEGNVN